MRTAEAKTKLLTTFIFSSQRERMGGEIGDCRVTTKYFTRCFNIYIPVDILFAFIIHSPIFEMVPRGAVVEI